MTPDVLMARYCDGDHAAFRALYQLTAPRLLGYLRRLCRDKSAAEDLLQQTFLKLHDARATYVRGADPMKWLYTIAHRACLDELRRRQRARVRLAESDAALPEPSVDISGTPVEAGPPDAVDPELRDAARAAISALPERQRAAVVLLKVEGKSSVEAAAILRTTPGAVKLRAHRGYRALKTSLGERALRAAS